MEEFKERLHKAMELKKMSAAELSRKTNIKPPMISDYLSGKYKAKQDKIYILAKALDVNEGWLMGYDVNIKRIPDEIRNNDDNILLDKIKSLTIEQKEIINKMIDNMK